MKEWMAFLVWHVQAEILIGYNRERRIYSRIWYRMIYASAIEWAITNQLISTAWFSEQEMYKELYEKNKKMTEWMLQNFEVKE